MKVAVLGTGTVGRTLAGGIAAAGNDVTIGTRDVAALEQREDLDGLRDSGVALARFDAAAAGAELVVNATAGVASLSALAMAGDDNLAGKIVVDVANALDFSAGMPPTLAVSNTDSLGEQIQRAHPEARVVKTLNTVNAELMVQPQRLAGGGHDMFVCGNDAGAKARVTAMLQDWFGWQTVIDLGDISAARGMEMYLPLWLRLMGAVGSVSFNVKVVR